MPGAIAETNIDITLCTENLWIENWKVLDEGNSDHRLIVYTLQSLRVTRDRRDLRAKGCFAIGKQIGISSQIASMIG